MGGCRGERVDVWEVDAELLYGPLCGCGRVDVSGVEAEPALLYEQMWWERVEVWEVDAEPDLCYGQVWGERADVYVEPTLLYGQMWWERVDVWEVDKLSQTSIVNGCERVDVWEVDKLSEPSFMDGCGGEKVDVWEVDTETALPYGHRHWETAEEAGMKLHIEEAL
ncbi:unnamed protein product [Arctogadus glacialis]